MLAIPLARWRVHIVIGRDEIEQVASELGIHSSSVQRDYVNGWILAAIYSHSGLGKQLILNGGNGFRKGYFESARYSADLDFTIESGIDDARVESELKGICEFLKQRVGIDFQVERTRVERKKRVNKDLHVTEGRLYFKDFYGVDSEAVLAVRMDVTQFGRVYLPVQSRPLIHPYSDRAACQVNIRCLKLEEMIAIKMRCLLQRRHVADLFDLIYSTVINPQFDIDRRQLLETFFRITVFGSSPSVAKGLLLRIPFEGLRAAWSTLTLPMSIGVQSFEKAVDMFVDFIRKLIEDPETTERHSTFFPANLRNPIMKAADDQTLLKVDYKGSTRLVEPYSLTFKRRKDGIGREYLYVWDRTGGSTGPGIKTFVAANTTSIENTTTAFKPREEVELRKSGGAETAGIFSAQRRARSYRSLYEERYRVQCIYCDKVFTRKKFSLKLNPHKDRFGDRCLGRRGYSVD